MGKLLMEPSEAIPCGVEYQWWPAWCADLLLGGQKTGSATSNPSCFSWLITLAAIPMGRQFLPQCSSAPDCFGPMVRERGHFHKRPQER